VTQAVISILFGYVLGSIPFALIVGLYLGGIDLRKIGSGNLGATNMFRVLGTAPALLVLTLDAAKGAAPVLLARSLGATEAAAIFAGMAAIIGHSASLFIGFRGGKGVATGAGVMLTLAPSAVFMAVGIWVMTVAITRYVSLGSILAALSVPFILLLQGTRGLLLVVTSLAAAFVVYKHRPNIQRLLRGTESKFGQKVNRQ